MLNAMKVWNAWATLAMQTAVTGFEAQNVMALRFMRFAAGGTLAKSEASRMITEKVLALGEAQALQLSQRSKATRAIASRPKCCASTSGACARTAGGSRNSPVVSP